MASVGQDQQEDPNSERRSTPEEKLMQAIDMMETGLRWKRAALVRDNPDASKEQLDQLYLEWLQEND